MAKKVQGKYSLCITDMLSLCETNKAGYIVAKDAHAVSYLTLGRYPSPEQENPDAHAKALLTTRFAQWLLTSYPEDAKKFDLDLKPIAPYTQTKKA